MTLTYRTKDHPEAGGRRAVPGQQQWVLTFPLDSGDDLVLKLGRHGRESLVEMLAQEERDDARAAPPVFDAVGAAAALRFALAEVDWLIEAEPGVQRCRFCHSSLVSLTTLKTANVKHRQGCPYQTALVLLRQLEGQP